MLPIAKNACLIALILVALGAFGRIPLLADKTSPASHDVGTSSGKNLPGATSDTSLSIYLVPPFNEKRNVFGEWESTSASFYLKNTAGRKVNLAFHSKQGVIVHLKDSSGQVRKVASPWDSGEGFVANAPFPSFEVPQDANVTAKSLSLNHLFGKLKPDRYTMVVEMPAEQLSLDGKRIGKVVSKPWRFDVVTLTPALKKKITAPTKQPAGVTLEAIKTKNDQGNAVQALKLTNGSKKTIAYSGYQGGT